MAKSKEKIKAIALRRNGASIKDIARILGVSKSSASLWCGGVVLSSRQIAALHLKMIKGGYGGRLKGAQMQKTRKLEKINRYREAGISEMDSISKRDLFVLGLGLYLGEGNKTGSKFQFTNSNPMLVKIVMEWLEKNFEISPKDFVYRVAINEIHRYRIHDVYKQWSKLIGAPLSQFKLPVFIKVKNKKIYENMNAHLGTMMFGVVKSSDLQYRVCGLMHGILHNTTSYCKLR